MLEQPDYSILDETLLGKTVFYPRKDWSPPPANAVDHSIFVDYGVAISCRFYIHSQDAPSILYFHGNGEVVSDYNPISVPYMEQGINLFVTDYRGYGTSTGSPSFGAMVTDAHKIFRVFREILSSESYSDTSFVMGRSLGSFSAVELAARYPQELKGLIIDSGTGSLRRFVEELAVLVGPEQAHELQRLHSEKVRSISLPALLIHGERDEMLPLETAVEFYNALTVQDKELVTIPGAGHNDIMWVGQKLYFPSIGQFVRIKK